MRPELAALVDPVFDRTWQVLELKNPDPPGPVEAGPADTRPADKGQLATARAELKELLSRVRAADMARAPAGNDYLGLVYPLVCWIDEVLTADDRVGQAWNENKLEGEWFGTNDRAWMFWRQAELAETLDRREDLAVFYACVQLGFTGQYRTEPEKLDGWIHRTRVALGWVPELKLAFSHDLPPAADVPPLTGTAAIGRASQVGWSAAVVLLPVLSYLAVTAWAR